MRGERELRRPGGPGRRRLRLAIPERRAANFGEDLVERKPMHGRKPRERLVGAFLASAFGEPELLENRDRGGISGPDLTDGHRRGYRLAHWILPERFSGIVGPAPMIRIM